MENLLVSKLGTNIAHVDILQRLVCLHVSDLDDERMGSVGLSIDDQLSHHHGVVGSSTQRADPPLGGSQAGRVDDEGLVLGAPGRGRLETADVRTVAQLRLRIASDDLVFLCPVQEELVLLWSSLLSKSDLEAQCLVS